MTNGRSRLQPNDTLGYAKHAACFGWFKLLLPPDAVLNTVSAVRTNVIFWNPSSAGLRNVGGGPEKLGGLRSMHKYCLFLP